MNPATRLQMNAEEDQISVFRRFLMHYFQTFNSVMQHK